MPLETLLSRDYDVSPALVHEQLRARYGPVAPIDLLGVPAWFVLGYDQVLSVMQNVGDVWSKRVDTWRAYTEGRVPADWPLLALLQADNMGFDDGERHHALRAAWDAALRPYQDPAHPQAQMLERAMLGFCDELIGVMTDGTSAGWADLCTQYGRPLPLMVANRMLGVTLERGEDMMMDQWRLLDGPDSAGAYQRLYAALLELATAKRHQPGEDLPSYMLAAKPDLTDEELARDLFMLPGFLDFTGSLICNVIVELMTNPQLRAGLPAGAVEETVNRVALLNPALANLTFRYARTDVRLGRFTIAAGDPVMLSIAAAHADPRFADALSRDPLRSTRAHLAWGAGAHGCPSRRLATKMTTIAVRRLQERFSTLKLALPADQLPWRASPFVRAVRTLPVQYELSPGFTPTATPTAAPAEDAGEGRQPSRSGFWTFLRKLRRTQ
ncbi:cytochrome P450 [Sphaerisporangium fuscum]|uniref:cytochrome P450 n=1 Tax=Sphaerisporangium fuscum TaxID=2835868 RepID=UPI001BDD3C81|nr:cytochrome P450 [Sphaerisporangium fuscum]